jgi:hypothetical protein
VLNAKSFPPFVAKRVSALSMSKFTVFVALLAPTFWADKGVSEGQ